MENAVSDTIPSVSKGGPDVPYFIGLKIFDAYKCTTQNCGYICGTDSSKQKHASVNHSREKTKTWINCKAQQLTNKSTYLQVLVPANLLFTTSFDSLFLEIEQTLPNFIAPPSDQHTRDLPTFIITRGIYEHLKDWYGDQKRRQSVVAIYTQPESDFSIKLKALCLDYIVDLSTNARSRDFTVLRPFEVYPM